MRVLEVTDNQKEQWNDFVRNNAADGGLLQSWQWGEFKKSLGHKIFRLAVLENEKIVAVALILKHNLPLGQSYLYCPRGPIISQNLISTGLGGTPSAGQESKLLFNKIKKIAEKENSLFLKIEPAFGQVPSYPLRPQSEASKSQVPRLGFKKSTDIQPTETLILDLSKSEQEILAQMKQKTRYNIRLAEKKGVKIKIHDTRYTIHDKEFEEFWRLISQTAKRQKIKPHPKEYYQKILEILGQDEMAKLFVALHKNKIIAVNLVAFFGDFATYLHGAADYEFREIMAPHLLQWRQIQEAKKLGLKYYDFWGVSTKKPSWQGITRFKTGFAPNTSFTKYFGGYDLVYKPFWYKLYQLGKRLKR